MMTLQRMLFKMSSFLLSQQSVAQSVSSSMPRPSKLRCRRRREAVMLHLTQAAQCEAQSAGSTQECAATWSREQAGSAATSLSAICSCVFRLDPLAA
uniref:Putative secreted protein n=1 Tax=Ixodes ricinus TaxID=34613 RepID=A0A6B0UEU4_IXORI